ncbi:alpha/beta fold hydrolase [Saccharothrix coeruleofusca]|uniref:alpha/beta fold hydrolase n=1 Tax=Saccharothrix coeruleofusca TaxID=33919 RepID=UPI001E4447C0|nr:alpha/beta fold hydrolase [Saccharothrix coeruleofusca]
MSVHVRTGGEGPALVLLHGLGATGEVWREVVPRWPGSWIVPDLPGHGRSDPLTRYSFGALAAAVAPAIPAGPVAVLGHSLGGVVALALASGWFGVEVRAVAGLGVKLLWTPEELAKAAEVARRPPKVFDSREDAEAWASRLAGVPLSEGVTGADGGLGGGPGGWRAALDPAAFAVGAPDVPGLLAVSKADPTVLAAGADDHMCPPADLLAADPNGLVLPGVGHNAHVEAPSALDPVLELLR